MAHPVRRTCCLPSDRGDLAPQTAACGEMAHCRLSVTSNAPFDLLPSPPRAPALSRLPVTAPRLESGILYRQTPSASPSLMWGVLKADLHAIELYIANGSGTGPAGLLQPMRSYTDFTHLRGTTFFLLSFSV